MKKWTKEEFAGESHETLVAMLREVLEWNEDLEDFVRSLESQLKEFRRRQPRDLSPEEEPPRRRRS